MFSSRVSSKVKVKTKRKKEKQKLINWQEGKVL
jgi:hypothetical protein